MTRIAEPEAKGKQDSGNSSKPPSSDLGRKRKPPVEPSGRKRGGQPGHAGQNRELAPPEEVDEVVPTNNAAERSIRKAVLWRKVSLGADSEEGGPAPALRA